MTCTYLKKDSRRSETETHMNGMREVNPKKNPRGFFRPHFLFSDPLPAPPADEIEAGNCNYSLGQTFTVGYGEASRLNMESCHYMLKVPKYIK